MMTIQQALEWLRDNAKQVQAEIDAGELDAIEIGLYYGFVRSEPDNAAQGLFIAAVEDYIQAKKAKE